MKRYLAVIAATAMVIAMVGGAWAASPATDTVDVSATVQSQCGSAVNGAFSTLSIDPSNNNPQPFVVSTDATIRCTSNKTTGTITASSLYGTSKTTPVNCNNSLQTGFTMQGSGPTKTINYSFQCKTNIAGVGFGSSSDVSLGIGATVLAADAITADYDNGGTYHDTVTLTIAY